MSIRVSTDELFEQLDSWGWCYLLTSSGDDRPHLLALTPQPAVTSDGHRVLRFDAGTGRARRNAGARPEVSLVFPPRDPAGSPDHIGYSLVVDGVASAGGGDVEGLLDIEPVSAMLHRPAPR